MCGNLADPVNPQELLNPKTSKDIMSIAWEKLVCFVQYASSQCCTVVMHNVKFLHESYFVSVGESVILRKDFNF